MKDSWLHKYICDFSKDKIVSQQHLTTLIPQTHQDTTSACTSPQNSENPPGPYDFIDDSQPVATYTPKPRKLQPHKRT